MDKWMVFCCGQRYVEEISKAGDDQFSNWKALQQVSPNSILRVMSPRSDLDHQSGRCDGVQPWS